MTRFGSSSVLFLYKSLYTFPWSTVILVVLVIQSSAIDFACRSPLDPVREILSAQRCGAGGSLEEGILGASESTERANNQGKDPILPHSGWPYLPALRMGRVAPATIDNGLRTSSGRIAVPHHASRLVIIISVDISERGRHDHPLSTTVSRVTKRNLREVVPTHTRSVIRRGGNVMHPGIVSFEKETFQIRRITHDRICELKG